jgi:tetratricopeptide (TPR) repeat protein
MRRRLFLLLFLPALALLALAALPERAVELRDLGVAQLENERPADAERTFADLVKLAPEDPLGYANLAIAALRQQHYDAALAQVDQALAKAPGRADLLALRGEALEWTGRSAEALLAFDRAAAAAPDDVFILYAAFRQATTVGGEGSQELARRTLDQLARLRPENLLVLLQRGSRAIAGGDRATATASYLRVREILWQPPPAAVPALAEVLAALEKNDLAAARVPALRLENVLKSSPLYQGSQRELTRGILGVPVTRLREEPPPAEWGPGIAVTLRATRLDATPTLSSLAVADFDGDQKPDLARLVSGEHPGLEVRLAASGWKPSPILPVPGAGDLRGLRGLLAADFDNDGALDLLAYGEGALVVWKGNGKGGFAETATFGLAGAGATAAAVLDFDGDGDLDLALGGGRARAADLWQNPGVGALAAVGEKALPPLPARAVRQVIARDLDRDGDLDLLLVHDAHDVHDVHDRGLTWLDNLRQGRFADRTAAAGLDQVPPARAAVAVDLDDDGRPDLAVLAAAGDRLSFWHNLGGRFARWDLAANLPPGTRATALVAADLDNDGHLDLALTGEPGLLVLARRGAGFALLPVIGVQAHGGHLNVAPSNGALTAADLDGDGDLDLVVAGPDGLYRVDNDGGNKNHWLDVRLRGLTKGSGKNNLLGVGATLEVRAGTAYQLREAEGEVTHFGLGRLRQAELLRVVWTNGVPQNRLQVAGDQAVVEEQVLKGSCPFLYLWDGERMRFATDLLWASPLGLPVAPGVWAGADPEELVRLDGARPERGVYRLSVTEELWEAAFFDRVALWVVDHPEDVEVASNLRVLPGPKNPGKVLGSRGLQPVAAAWDGAGREVTDRVRARDEVYASGYLPGPYQGVSEKPWTFTFDLGRAPEGSIRLHLDGWIFPADASLNLAIAQRRDLAVVPPRLEVETAAGWQVLLPAMGYPAGKTKTLVVDTPPLSRGARRLRIVTSLWLAWDRIAWTARPPADAEAIVRARLAPASAELRYRGFSTLVRNAPNGPHGYDYERVSTEAPWLPFPGRYTRYGDVRELLAEVDDRSVILAAGDELALTFDTANLPPPPPGFRRTVFLESVGWDKDADRNTWEAKQVEPLPFRAMTGYPFAPGERFPDTPALRAYRERWLTREVRPDPSAAGGAAAEAWPR